MFGIGMPELILILAVALVVIGPKKLPDLAKSLGKAMGEFKKATNEIKDSMQLDNGIKEVKTSFEDLEKELKQPVQSAPSAASADRPTPDVEESASAEGDRETDSEAAEIPDAEPTEAELEEYASEATPPDSATATEEATPEEPPHKADT
jgi:sec-independent protein translocase protein TatB